MNENEEIFKEGLAKGLRPSDRNQRNSQAMILAKGMIPEDGALHSVDELTAFAGLSALQETFPYPQLHRGQSVTLALGRTKIWELVAGVWSLKLQNLTEGTIWTIADFYDFLVLTNGKQIVKRDPSAVWTTSQGDDEIPLCGCVGAVNGQLFVGSPQVGL